VFGNRVPHVPLYTGGTGTTWVGGTCHVVTGTTRVYTGTVSGY
jgi:hypothetical protein